MDHKRTYKLCVKRFYVYCEKGTSSPWKYQVSLRDRKFRTECRGM